MKGLHPTGRTNGHPARAPGGRFVCHAPLAVALVALAAGFGCADPASLEQTTERSDPQPWIEFTDAPWFAGPLDTLTFEVASGRLPPDAVLAWSTDDDAIEIVGSGSVGRLVAPAVVDTIRIVVEAWGDGLLAADTQRVVVAEQMVVLKADDLTSDPDFALSAAWRAFLEYVERRSLRAGLGIIGNSLERGVPGYVDAVRLLAHSAAFEIWSHGYDHALAATDSSGNVVDEFRGTSYEHQLTHLLAVQRLAADSLGVTIRTFGAPGNGVDTTTTRALAAVPELDVWLFGKPDADLLVLPRVTEAESSPGNPSYEAFVETYRPNAPVLTLQIHPNGWSSGEWPEFERIVDDLIERGAAFVRPSDYLEYLRRDGRASTSA